MLLWLQVMLATCSCLVPRRQIHAYIRPRVHLHPCSWQLTTAQFTNCVTGLRLPAETRGFPSSLLASVILITTRPLWQESSWKDKRSNNLQTHAQVRDFKLHPKCSRTALFWVITQRVVVIPCQSFGAMHRQVVPKRRQQITTTRCVRVQKKAVVNCSCTAAHRIVPSTSRY